MAGVRRRRVADLGCDARGALISAVVLAWWLGIYAVVFGISLLACGWQLRGQRTV